MSSSGEGETFTIGGHVDATDGRCGSLIRLIVDPTTESFTHLAVSPATTRSVRDSSRPIS